MVQVMMVVEACFQILSAKYETDHDDDDDNHDDDDDDDDDDNNNDDD